MDAMRDAKKNAMVIVLWVSGTSGTLVPIKAMKPELIVAIMV